MTEHENLARYQIRLGWSWSNCMQNLGLIYWKLSELFNSTPFASWFPLPALPLSVDIPVRMMTGRKYRLSGVLCLSNTPQYISMYLWIHSFPLNYWLSFIRKTTVQYVLCMIIFIVCYHIQWILFFSKFRRDWRDKNKRFVCIAIRISHPHNN